MMTPHEWNVLQRRREQRRDAGWAFLIIAIVLIGGGMFVAAFI